MDFSRSSFQGLAPATQVNAEMYAYLQERQSTGEAPLLSPRAAALSQMEFQHIGGRSPSFMDLSPRQQLQQQPQQVTTSPFQLSKDAMLVGTVAALQEESGQLREQWKSDVRRLESELDQLRSAASWALPHLAEAQRQQEIRTESMPIQVPLLHGGGKSVAPMSPRGYASEARLSRPDDHASALTEALMQQMRASNASEHPPHRDPMLEASMDGSVYSAAFGTILQRQNSPLSSPAQPEKQPPAVQQRPQEQPQGGDTSLGALGEMYQELERMEFALQQVREENAKLKEEKANIEEAHNRDVAALESMLSQVMSENKRLKELSEGNKIEAKKYEDLADKIMNLKPEVPQTPSSDHSEPEMERSSEFSRMRFDLGAAAGYS